MIQELDNILEWRDEQQGFMKGRSRNDIISVIRQLIEKSLEFCVPAYMCFIDIRKAFDSIRLVDIVRLLQAKGVSHSMVRLIVNIYSGNKIKVEPLGIYLREIEANRGIRRGDSLSPLLHNVIMNSIINDIKDMKGYPLGRHNIYIVYYADNAVLVADNEGNLQRLVYQLSKLGKEVNLAISIEKTKCMISPYPLRCKLVVDAKPIEQVMEIKYLGVLLTRCGRLESEVQEQTIRAN